MTQIHFLVGMSRAGVTWLSRVLNLHPDVAVFGQSRFWGKHYLPPRKDGLYGEEHRRRLLSKVASFAWDATIGEGIGCFSLSPDAFRARLCAAIENVPVPSPPVRFFEAMADAVAAIKSAAVVIEKTPHHLLHWRRILEALPDARFILLRADAPDHLRALKAQKDLLYHPAAASLVWRRYDFAARDLQQARPERVLLVRSEDLRLRPESVLPQLISGLGLRPFSVEGLPPFYWGRETTAVLPPLSGGDRFWLQHVCGVSVEEGQSSRVASALSIARSWTSLPLFAVRHLMQNLPEIEGSRLAYYRTWLAGDPSRE